MLAHFCNFFYDVQLGNGNRQTDGLKVYPPPRPPLFTYLSLPHFSPSVWLPDRTPQVDSWLDFSDSFSSEHIASLSKHLAGRSFLAGGAFSLADVAVYFACAAALASAPPAAGKQLDLCRW